MASSRSRPDGATASSPSACSTASTAATQSIIAEAVELARRARRAQRADHLRPAPVRGGPARLPPAGAHQHRAPRRAGRGARRGRVLRAAVHPRVLADCRRTSSCTASWSSGCTPRRWSSARTSGSGTRRPATSPCCSGWAARSASPPTASRCSPTDGTVLSATYVRSCVQAGDMARRPRRPRPAAPRRRRRRARRPARARTRLPDREPAHRRVGRGAGRRRLRRPGRPAGRVGPHRARRRRSASAAISVGTNPTFEVRQRRVEAYILDFDGDLYGDALGVEFVERLRGMERFDSVDALVDPDGRGRGAHPRPARLQSPVADPAGRSVGREQARDAGTIGIRPQWACAACVMSSTVTQTGGARLHRAREGVVRAAGQRRQEADHRRVRRRRRRHRLAEVQVALLPPHQRPHRAPQAAQARPPQPARPAAAGRPAPPAAELPAQTDINRYRSIIERSACADSSTRGAARSGRSPSAHN